MLESVIDNSGKGLVNKIRMFDSLGNKGYALGTCKKLSEGFEMTTNVSFRIIPDSVRLLSVCVQGRSDQVTKSHG